MRDGFGKAFLEGKISTIVFSFAESARDQAMRLFGVIEAADELCPNVSEKFFAEIEIAEPDGYTDNVQLRKPSCSSKSYQTGYGQLQDAIRIEGHSRACSGMLVEFGRFLKAG